MIQPSFIFKLAELVAKDTRLNRHTASAYVLALEHLGLKPKGGISGTKSSKKAYETRIEPNPFTRKEISFGIPLPDVIL
ncbi:MAG: hypothetical protein G5Z42_01200 [Caldisphaeraceae archaeon]|nr:hypothetical protein [Caldisphaeraceae archaeon]